MKMCKLGHSSEFVLFPPLILIATLLAFHSPIPPQPMIWAIVHSAGLIGWSSIEYLHASHALSSRAVVAAVPRSNPSVSDDGPAIAGVGVNMISHILIAHHAEKQFDREHHTSDSV